ncbi:MAG: phospho-N-acetylmuramoyl-pentapeptide-transferase [Cognaticolwellia sp.]|jgi:phospho-N-acetylmuramoyl-pentapeptide-transferase
MLYHLFDFLERNYEFTGASLFQFITFRTGIAILISLTISLIFGGKIIKMIQNFQVLEKQRALGLPGEELKKKTPTMGGIIIILAIIVPTLLMADLTNIYIQLLLLCTIWMGLIGFLDDYLKLKRGKDGLAGRYKILGQVGLGIIVGSVMFFNDNVTVRMDKTQVDKHNYEVISEVVDSETGVVSYNVKTALTNLPFFKNNTFNYADLLTFLGEGSQHLAWIIFIPLVVFIVTAVSNAANLTDGLDGLATGTSAIIVATLGILTYVSGNAIFAKYLGILYIPDSAEVVIFIGCFLGGCLGFLWYNSYPAKIFMGDTGSLTLGGIIAALAIIIRKEWLIPILCGVFLVENLSVILQVAYFKYTKNKYGEGRRIFLMSPLHHHYQKKGWHEVTIVNRFLIVGVILAVLTVMTLKVR